MEVREEQYHLVVSPAKTPERIDTYVAHAITGASRSKVRKLIDDRKVLVNGVAVKASHRVAPNERIDVVIPAPQTYEAVPQDIPLDIIHQDADIVVLNKPAGLIVHPSPDTPDGTLVNALLYHIPDLSGINGVLRPGIVHRLDKDTTGLMVISKTDRAHRELSRQFAERSLRKQYLAVVWGAPWEAEGVIDRPLKRSRKDIRKMTVDPGGKEAVTEYTVREYFRILSLLEVRPRTGRTHQIRAHLGQHGHPVFGDLLYGGREKRLTRLKSANRQIARQLLGMIERQALHARSLRFTHPGTGREVEYQADLPEDFSNVLAFLRAECAVDTAQP